MKNQLPKLSEEDKNLWAELTGDVNKITPPDRDLSAKPVVFKEFRPTIAPHTVYHGETLQELRHGAADNIDKRTAQKFKRGEFRIERRLDLHGLKEDQAWEKVQNFIQNCYLQDCRCVLIITGKGMHKEDGIDIFAERGVLKDRVPQWLNSPSLRPFILSFDYAQPKDGGSGALYILLRRRHDTAEMPKYR